MYQTPIMMPMPMPMPMPAGAAAGAILDIMCHLELFLFQHDAQPLPYCHCYYLLYYGHVHATSLPRRKARAKDTQHHRNTTKSWGAEQKTLKESPIPPVAAPWSCEATS
jgi:hypothetical protein